MYIYYISECAESWEQYYLLPAMLFKESENHNTK